MWREAHRAAPACRCQITIGAFLDRTDRIDKAAADRQVDRSRCDLLRNGVEVGKNRIDLMSTSAKKPFSIRYRPAIWSWTQIRPRLRLMVSIACAAGCEHRRGLNTDGACRRLLCSVTLHRFGPPPLIPNDTGRMSSGTSGSVGHDGRHGSVGGGLRLASLVLQFIPQNSQLPCDSQIKGVMGEKSATSRQLHEVGLRRHGRTIDASAHAYQILRRRVRSLHSKSPTW